LEWISEVTREHFSRPIRIVIKENEMKPYLANLPTRTWALLVVPAVLIAYPIVRIVIPAVVHAVVPDALRTVLSFL
jgi:hypothetical protein